MCHLCEHGRHENFPTCRDYCAISVLRHFRIQSPDQEPSNIFPCVCAHANCLRNGFSPNITTSSTIARKFEFIRKEGPNDANGSPDNMLGMDLRDTYYRNIFLLFESFVHFFDNGGNNWDLWNFGHFFAPYISSQNEVSNQQKRERFGELLN